MSDCAFFIAFSGVDIFSMDGGVRNVNGVFGDDFTTGRDALCGDFTADGAGGNDDSGQVTEDDLIALGSIAAEGLTIGGA